MKIHSYLVMLNLFQHPFSEVALFLIERWTLKQVQGDGLWAGSAA